MQEIQLHAISAWTVADIITALRNDVDAYECRDLFAPGFVTERLADLVWSRSHGEEKRELVVREILRTTKAIFRPKALFGCLGWKRGARTL